MRKIKINMGDKDGKFAVKFKSSKESKTADKKVVFTGIFLNFPADSEALGSWHKSKNFSVGEGSEKVTFSGIEAAAAAKVSHDFETLRGKARSKLEGGASPAAVEIWLRDQALNYWPGKTVVEVVKKVEVSQDRVAEFYAAGDLPGLMAYLASCGAESPVTEPEPTIDPIAAEAQRLADEVDARLAAADQDDEDDDSEDEDEN